MSVTVTRSEGLTVLALASDDSSACPPLCQLLGALCCSPRLCSGTRRLTPQRGGPQAVLGALWIISGILHLGLGSVFLFTRHAPSDQLKETYAPLWLGGLFVIFGICCIRTERRPRPILVLLSGFLNLTGAALSFTAVVWYAVGFEKVGFEDLCESENYDYWNTPTPSTTLSPEDQALLERCRDAQRLLWTVSLSVSSVLVSLSVLDFCLGLSATVLGCRSLRRGTRTSESRDRRLLREDEATVREEAEEVEE